MASKPRARSVRCEVAADGRADGGTADDRALLASVLRTIGQRTASANIRNWTLTRARELDGLQDLSRLRRHRFWESEVLAAEPAVFVHALRVLLVPDRAEALDVHVAWEFAGEGRSTSGLTMLRTHILPLLLACAR